MTGRRPGIASTNRRRLGDFASLLELATHDATALDGLAFAYRELGSAERRALAQAVLQDASDPARALAALLAAEDDPGARRRLAEALGRLGRIEHAAFVTGDRTCGEARLELRAPGLGRESLRVRWNASEIDRLEIKPRPEELSASLAADAESVVPLEHAVELLTPLLWDHIRAGGELPEGIERFAGFFSFA